MRDDRLTTSLAELSGSRADVGASAVISDGGLLMARWSRDGLQESLLGLDQAVFGKA
jgi:hypothetical protein